MFSDAMSSICDCWRVSSRSTIACSSGSESASVASKKAPVDAPPAIADVPLCFTLIALSLPLPPSRKLGHALDVPSAFEGRVEKCLQAILRHLDADQPRAERQHIGVIVRAGEPCGGHVQASRRTHAAMPVGGDRHADPGA